jgi:hypothetical protein
MNNLQMVQALSLMAPLPFFLGLGVWNYRSWPSDLGTWPPWAIVANRPVYFISELVALSLVVAASTAGPLAARAHFSRVDGSPKGGYKELLPRTADALFFAHVASTFLLMHFAGYYEVGLALSADR